MGKDNNVLILGLLGVGAYLLLKSRGGYAFGGGGGFGGGGAGGYGGGETYLQTITGKTGVKTLGGMEIIQKISETSYVVKGDEGLPVIARVPIPIVNPYLEATVTTGKTWTQAEIDARNREAGYVPPTNVGAGKGTGGGGGGVR